jgi:hypothetical protein
MLRAWRVTIGIALSGCARWLCRPALAPMPDPSWAGPVPKDCPLGLHLGPKPSAFALAASSGEASARGRSFTIGNRTSVVGLSGDACLGRYRRIGCSTFPCGFAQRAFQLLRRRCIVASITSLALKLLILQRLLLLPWF